MNKQELKKLIRTKIGGQGNQVDTGGALPSMLNNIVDMASKPYLSLERLRPYIYRVTFDALPSDGGLEPTLGGCSSYVSNGKLYRNLDFYYDESASFIVRTKDFEGMSFITGLNDGDLDDAKIAQLPYVVVDGRNNDGIMVSTHVLYNDWKWSGCGDKSILLTRLPFLALTKVKSMATIAEDLGDVLNNLALTPSLVGSEYLLQVLVTDGITTYVLMPPTEANQPYVLQDITSSPKLSNFRWVADSIVDRVNLQDRPTGVERFNLMPCPLENLRFTKAYETSDRLSEFIGIRETTKDSTDEELTEIYNIAKGMYEDRKRDGLTWQTMHSVVYGVGMENLFIQEDWESDCVLGDMGAQIGDLASLDTDHKSSLVEAINEVADALETDELVVSMAQSNAERKVIYDLCVSHPQLAKNVVFLNTEDNIYYRVNGYRYEEGAVMFHTIMVHDGALSSINLKIASNGTIMVV